MDGGFQNYGVYRFTVQGISFADSKAANRASSSCFKSIILVSQAPIYLARSIWERVSSEAITASLSREACGLSRNWGCNFGSGRCFIIRELKPPITWLALRM